MDATVSVSKGVFLFPNGFKRTKKSKKKPKQPFFESIFNKEPWYVTYKYNWNIIENQLRELHERTYSVLLNDIVSYVSSFELDHQYDSIEGIIPSATLLTGVNRPDHVNQFLALIHKIREDVTPHVAMISSQDAQTVKHLVESAVSQLIHGQDYLDSSADDSLNEQTIKLKKNQCTMRSLLNWYQSKYYVGSSPKKLKQAPPKKTLVIIMPDFESFSCNVLQDFVMIVSSYITSLPIVLIFGVATSVSALHKSFPYHVSSKLLIKVFHSHPSHVYMNQVLESIFLTHTSPFHLSGKAFELLTDVFLFYDFSVTGLIQSIKYCMMEHYYGDNIKALCCARDKIKETISKLTPDDLENIRQLVSFRPFLEIQDCETKIGLFEDNNFFREVLCKEMHKLHDYFHSFYLCVRVLAALIKDLPKNILGKTAREIYAKCSMEHITGTQPFRECMQLLSFQSQVKMADSIKNALKEINAVLQTTSPVKPLRCTPSKANMNITLNNDLGEDFAKLIRIHFLTFLRQIENASNETLVLTNANVGNDHNLDIDVVPGNRYKLKEKLLKATRVEKIQSEFEMVRSRFVSYLEEVFAKGLQPPHTQSFHELVLFSDVAGVKKQIVGSPRGALHLALNNPVHYLQCSCCHLPSPESVSERLPDVSVAYKLHRECGKHVNLYDWLQAFAAVLRPSEPDDERHQDAAIQIRFTRAVAELQFLGFIKSSKKKTDHVMRLTW